MPDLKMNGEDTLKILGGGRGQRITVNVAHPVRSLPLPQQVVLDTANNKSNQGKKGSEGGTDDHAQPQTIDFLHVLAFRCCVRICNEIKYKEITPRNACVLNITYYTSRSSQAPANNELPYFSTDATDDYSGIVVSN